MPHINIRTTRSKLSPPPMPDPDEQLVQAAKAGCPSAFSELHVLYERRIYRTICSITQNKEDAEDATQDTFLRALRAIRTFEGRATFYSWLTRIAINSALMLLRKKKRRRELPLELPYESMEGLVLTAFQDRAANPAQSFERREQYSCLLQSIHSLKPRLRIVVEDQMSQDGSVRDAARRLKISESAVKSRLYRARMRLSMTNSPALQQRGSLRRSTR